MDAGLALPPVVICPETPVVAKVKIGKQYLGKMVELTWRDPRFDRVELHAVRHGRDALAVWQEFGRIDEIVDGVVRIIHSAGKETAGAPAIDEICATWVAEDLVDSIVVYEPVKVTEGGES